MTNAPVLKIVEIPAGLSAQEVEDQLNAPYAEGYYLLHPIAPEPPIVFRAVYKLRTKGADSDAALDFIKANPSLSIKQTAAQLAVKGIVRSQDWVGERKRALASAKDSR